MKKLFVLLALFPFVAIADQHVPPGSPEAICTHDVVYTIYDEDGDVMDKTWYFRNWPLSCETSVRLKYETVRRLTENGETQFEALIQGQ